jgi:hypothetical protein
MDIRRARLWEWLAAGFGVTMVVAPFLGWYEVCLRGVPGTKSCRPAALTGWEAFAIADVIMLLAGGAAMAVLVLTITHRTPAVPIALTALGVLVSAVAAVLALLSLVAEPEGGANALLAGAWIGTGAAIGLTVSMLAAMTDERPRLAGSPGERRTPAVRTLRLSSSARDRSARGRNAAGGQPGGAA